MLTLDIAVSTRPGGKKPSSGSSIVKWSTDLASSGVPPPRAL
jgi:hypothetical protein